MKRAILLGVSAVMVVASMAIAGPAEARCSNPRLCAPQSTIVNILGVKKAKTVAHRNVAKRSTKIARKKDRALPANRQRVVTMIKQMAPRYGVPTWFALRIAKVESSYNPNARGRAGEYGVFQMKCATARLLGYQGKCRGLLNPSTNIQYGLRHLQLAMRSARGNLKLAASKHNGGLGRKRLVRAYVNRVF